MSSRTRVADDYDFIHARIQELNLGPKNHDWWVVNIDASKGRDWYRFYPLTPKAREYVTAIKSSAADYMESGKPNGYAIYHNGKSLAWKNGYSDEDWSFSEIHNDPPSHIVAA